MYTWRVNWDLLSMENVDDSGDSSESSLLKLVHAQEFPSNCSLREAL